MTYWTEGIFANIVSHFAKVGSAETSILFIHWFLLMVRTFKSHFHFLCDAVDIRQIFLFLSYDNAFPVKDQVDGVV